MGLVAALKRAEEQARKMAQAGMERTIVGLDDAERAIRRRMRVYPTQVPPLAGRTAPSQTATSGDGKTPIGGTTAKQSF